MSTPPWSRAAAITPPSLADVLVAIEAADLPARRKQDLASAVRSAARALGRSPEQVPADPRLLASRLAELAPLALGFSKPRWNNIRSLLRSAQRHNEGRFRTCGDPLMRAVIYARYSSENQREASIEDQLEVCRRRIVREGWTLLRTYTDAAISGASRFRPGLQQLRRDAEHGVFDVIVCEALDRIGRKLADVAELHDLLSYLGIKLVTLSTGEVTALHIGMLGTLAQLTLSDLREKTRRGQLGRALQGKIPGGHAFGYDVVDHRGKGAGGERAINPAEAAVVVGIFEAFANGESPRAIAKRLNAEGVPGPDGRAWRDTTIRGQVDRGTGLLNNAIYAGRLEWNRCSYVKDPRTGKRVARVNARQQWEIVEVPELRIVDDGLWQRVKERQQMVRIEIGRDGDGNALNRYGCASHKSKGTCSNTRTILRPEIEERVLAGLKERLLAPDLFREFADEVQRQWEACSLDADRERLRLERELSAARRKIEAMLKAIEDGFYTSSMKERMTALEAEKVAVQTRLDQLGAAPPIRLHPNLSGVYTEKVTRPRPSPRLARSSAR